MPRLAGTGTIRTGEFHRVPVNVVTLSYCRAAQKCVLGQDTDTIPAWNDGSMARSRDHLKPTWLLKPPCFTAGFGVVRTATTLAVVALAAAGSTPAVMPEATNANATAASIDRRAMDPPERARE
jgi:hypothetical protein